MATRTHKATKKYADLQYVEVVLPNRKKVRVPRDKDGYVPEEWLVLQEYDGGLTRASKDYDDVATQRLPTKVTPREAAAWVTNQDNVDIDNIDVQGTPMYNVGTRKGSRKQIHEDIVVFGTKEEEKKVRGLIDEAFTEDELKKATKGGITVMARPAKMDLVGFTDCASYVAVDRRRGMDNGVVTHEFVHVLRNRDPERKGLTRSARKNSKLAENEISEKGVSNIEESCTVAEQMARTRGKYHGSGYYWQVPVKDKKTKRWRSPTTAEANRMIEEDRKLFTRGTGKPLTGDAAIRSVEENWAKSHIARLKTGRTMAINDMARADPETYGRYSTRVKKAPVKKGPVKKAPARKSSKKTAEKPKPTSREKPMPRAKTPVRRISKGGKRK